MSTSWIGVSRGVVVVVIAIVAVAFAGSEGSRALPTGAAAKSSGAILFTSNREESDALFVVNADGTGLKRLVANTNDGYGRWSPDGSKVAFTRDAAGYHNTTKGQSLSVMTAAGASPRRLTGNDLAGGMGDFSWSPDGTRIVYVGRAEVGRAGLVVVRVDGRGETMIVRGNVAHPDWSPDGRRIAFTGWVGDGPGVRVVNADGSHEQLLVPNALGPHWSPDGSKLVFTGGQNLDELYIAKANGSGIREIAATTFTVSGRNNATWSPNGKSIAFVGDDFTNVYVVNANGSGLHEASRGKAYGVTWSPDGSKLAVEDGADIWVLAVDGGVHHAVTLGRQHGYANWGASWHPRGAHREAHGGKAASSVPPTGSIVAGSILRHPARVAHLAVDGNRAAIYFDSGCLELWRVPGSNPAVLSKHCRSSSPAPQATGVGGYPSPLELALAGTRIVFLSYDQGNHLYLGVGVANVATCHQASCPAGMGDLHGDDSVLVYDTWRQKGGPCEDVRCFREDKIEGTLWRIVGKRAVKIHSERTGLTTLAVNRGLIAVLRSDGPIELLRTDGTLVRRLAFRPRKVGAAALTAHQLAVQRDSSLSAYGIRTGRLEHTWPLAAGGQLADAENGIAVYVANSSVHLLRLSDGRDGTIHVPGKHVLAQIEPSGLFYSYTASASTFPGRVAFLSFPRLLSRLR